QDEARRLAEENPGVIEYRGHVRNPSRNFFPQVHLLSVMSVHEGLPMNLIEALAASVPAVATKVGGIPEIITDGQTGFLVARQPEALMRAIIDLYDHPEKLTALRRQARQRFEERFDIRQIEQQYYRVYTEPR
ncbi:MAG: glycosyltransferase, partial [Verrucomicrobia bacterium]|nr:glycosyltransferase [Verrucomicrobiota bacterium]